MTAIGRAPKSRSSVERPRVAVLMPAFGEHSLFRTLDGLRARASELGAVRVFVVDDGSEPPVILADLPPPSDLFSVVLARHVANLGQGAALETARCLALEDEEGPFDAYVTMDSDGQHRVDDVIALVETLERADAALGDRFAGGSRVPRLRALLIHAARAFEAIVVGHSMGDAHNGLRAFRGPVLERLSIKQNRMAHATELVRRLHSLPGVRVVEVPVTIEYTAASLAKGQRATGALTIVTDLFRRYLFGAPEP